MTERPPRDDERTPEPAEREDDEMDHRLAADEEGADGAAGDEEAARTPGQGP
jgi:hypothetical protein